MENYYVRPLTEQSTTKTSCPGDCEIAPASRQGSSISFWSGVRARDCSARICRIPACTEPEERLTQSANGSVTSWRCNGPEQVYRGIYRNNVTLARNSAEDRMSGNRDSYGIKTTDAQRQESPPSAGLGCPFLERCSCIRRILWY